MSKHEKTDGNSRPQGECFLGVLGNPGETHFASFLNSFSIAPQEETKMKIFTNFSHVVGKFLVTKNCTVMIIRVFRNGATNIITMHWMIIKLRFQFEFLTFSADEEAKLNEVPCQSPLVTK